MRILKAAAVTAALTLATAAYGQSAPGGGGGAAQPPAPSSPPDMMRGPDERLNELNRLSYDAARPGRTRSRTPVPIVAQDVTVGSEVHDSRGQVMATVEKVGDGFAVLAGSSGGKIEVEFASISKNYKGLMINMPKKKFDAMLGGGPTLK